MINFADMPLLEVAQLNTPEALDYFWAHVDDGYFEDRAWFYEYVADECKTIIDLQETKAIRVLDVGCAYGHFLQTLANQYPDRNYQMVGIDYSIQAIMKADKLHGQYSHNHYISFLLDDIEEQPIRYPNMKEYDLVVCIQSLEHMRNWQQGMKVIDKRTRPGGDIAITIPNGEVDRYPGHVNFWIEDEMRDILSEYGQVVGSWQFNDGKNLFFHVRKSG